MSDQSPVSAKLTISPMLGVEKRAISVIAVIAMLRMLGLFALLPVLSLYAAGLEGATPMLIGLAVGAYGLTQAGLQIPLGALSDRVGRVPVIVAGLAVFALGSLVAMYSDTIHGVIAGRLLQGAGAISATLTALIADATRAEVRTRSMAFVGIGIGASFLLAMVLGPLLAASFGVRALFGLGVLVAIVAALLLMLLPKGIEKPKRRAGRWDFRLALGADLLRLDFYIFTLHAILAASFVALPFLLSNSLELPVTSHWKLYIGALLVSLIGTIPLIVRDERQGKGGTIGAAVVLILIGEMLLAFAALSPASVFLALALFFAGFNFLEAGLPARLSLLASEESRGASLGVFSSFQFLGAFVGGLIGGLFLKVSDPGDVFLVCVLLASIWLILQGVTAFLSITRRN
ncbi:MAG: MFS transporter [Proteobacteria bacterium]|nr:MFS transporter [Pseudomonadota bacterium]